MSPDYIQLRTVYTTADGISPVDPEVLRQAGWVYAPGSGRPWRRGDPDMLTVKAITARHRVGEVSRCEVEHLLRIIEGLALVAAEAQMGIGAGNAPALGGSQ